MRGEPYTPAKMRVSWGDVPPDGSFLVTAAGSAYRVESASGRTIHVTRWPLGEVPEDALVIGWSWSPRKRRKR